MGQSRVVNLTEGKYFGDAVKSSRSEWFTVSITDYDPETYIHPHTHENDYLSILLKGTYREEGTGIQAGISPGEVLFRPAGYEHENAFHQQGGRCFNLELGPNFGSHYELSTPDSFQLYAKGSFPFLYRLYFSHYSEWNHLDLEEGVIHWLAAINQTECTQVPLAWITRTREILDHELHRFHTLSELAERVHVHPVYLARGFKKRTGATIGEYQLKRKLERAFRMLAETDQSISSVSHACGFFDDAHFVRTFKGSYGRSPLRFRKELRS